MTAAFAHGQKIVGLNYIDGLVQLPGQVVIYALGRDMRLICKFDNIVVMSTLILGQFSQSIGVFQAWGSGLESS